MLERACGLADVLADYYRNNQQARRSELFMPCISAHTPPLQRYHRHDLTGSIACLRHSALAAQVSLWLLNRRRTGERVSAEAAVATVAGTTSRAPSSADQRVTDASATVAASTAGAGVYAGDTAVSMSLNATAPGRTVELVSSACKSLACTCSWLLVAHIKSYPERCNVDAQAAQLRCRWSSGRGGCGGSGT